MKVYCKDCKYYGTTRENEIGLEFSNPTKYYKNWGSLAPITPAEYKLLSIEEKKNWYSNYYSMGVTTREGGRIKNCKHSVCFAHTDGHDIVTGKTNSEERIMGFAQLNDEFDCKYFKLKWYRGLAFFLRSILD